MLLYATADDQPVVSFKSDPGYYDNVFVGDKTAEVRLLSRSELADLLTHDPEFIEVTELDGRNPLRFPISYWHEVGEMVGSTLVLFCWQGGS